jgi:hypothetical protein
VRNREQPLESLAAERLTATLLLGREQLARELGDRLGDGELGSAHQSLQAADFLEDKAEQRDTSRRSAPRLGFIHGTAQVAILTRTARALGRRLSEHHQCAGGLSELFRNTPLGHR